MKCYFWKWGMWLCVFGHQVHIKVAKGHVPLFSERYGYRKAYYFAGLRFEFLRAQ